MLENRASGGRQRARRSSIPARLEMLEPRTLLSGITGYTLNVVSGPGINVAVDSSGDLWIPDGNTFGGTVLHKVVKNADGSLTDTVIPATGGDLWFSVYNPVNNSIYISSASDGKIYQFDTNGNLLNSYQPDDGNYISQGEFAPELAVTSDGAVWFATSGYTDNSVNNNTLFQVGRLDLNGTFSWAVSPTINATENGIHVAPDGSLWVGAEGIDQSNPGQSSLDHVTWNGSSIQIQNFAIPDSTDLLTGSTVAPDGSIWFAMSNDNNAAQYGRAVISDQIDQAVLSNGQLSFTEYDIPENPGDFLFPGGLAYDASTNQVWFSEQGDAGISSLDTTTGDFMRMKTPDGGQPIEITVTPTDVWAPGLGADTLYDIDKTTPQPIESTDPDIFANTGQLFSGPIATFVSSDPGDFTYTLTYGNNTVSTGTITNDPSGIYTINGSVTYNTDGTYPTLLTITSSTGDVATFNGQAVSTSSVPLVAQGVSVSGQKDVALAANVSGQSSLVVAQFSGPAASYTATINWGDNTSTTAQIVSAGNDQYYVEVPANASKTYSALGSFTITTTITDGTNTVTATSTATIGAVPVVASQNLVLQPLLGPIALGVVATFTADPLSTAAWFKATIHWGDGTTSTGLVIRTSAGTYEVIGLHIYTRKGTYTVDTNLVDSVDNETALATASITVKIAL